MNYLRYTGVLFAASIGVAVLQAVIERVLHIPSGRWGSIVAVMVAAMVEGQKFATAQGRLPEGAERRRFAGIATAINLVIAAVIVGLLALIDPDVAAMFSGDLLWVMALVLLVALGLIYLLSWSFVKNGAKSVLKAAERRAAREAKGR